ncbi:Type 1 glutamine amidotransferase-like domain-containing protein [Actinoplanes aureus]|uniref:Peptidase E n=1 Tax=Actinoplanes aureus TaxID=2792083 RepID=A0A931C740_9ACTN|nr:peptidase E [Actinoplanes aureus]MBG0561683.1 peptidase E [Actinoplanes aureus]
MRDDVAVTADVPTILATSAFFRRGKYGPMSLRPGAIHHFAAELANARKAPKICVLTQATGDPEARIGAFYAAFAGSEFTMSHLQLFPMPNVDDIRAHLLAQDIVWVDGGSVANLCAVWRVHGLDEILHEAWQAGVVMSGVSAGSICWHSGGSTDSYGLELRGFTDGLGWLPYSNGVHYDAEEQRRPKMHELIGDGTLADGYATDDGAGLVYRGTTLAEAVADREGPLGYELKRADDGSVTETPLPTRVLPVPGN